MLIQALMYDNLVIANGIKGKPVNKFILEPNLPQFYIPQELFLGRNVVTDIELIAWLEERVFPPNRTDVRRLLRGIGLKKYDFLDIALKTKSCLVEDGFWIKVNDTDTFRQNTIRGVVGYPDIDLGGLQE